MTSLVVYSGAQLILSVARREPVLWDSVVGAGEGGGTHEQTGGTRYLGGVTSPCRQARGNRSSTPAGSAL